MRTGAYALLLSSLLALAAYSPQSAAVVAKVNAVGTYDDGSIYIYFDRAISDCSATNRLDVAADNPSVKNVLSIAMTAFATGSNVEINPGSCSGEKPQFTTTGDSYFYLKK